MAQSRRKTNRSRPQGRPAQPGKQASGFIRLISGQWRGRKLPVHDVAGLRPTTDRVKETLFNWLAGDIHQARCLDLFAGSGSLGFEALSRYAGHVLMLEKDSQAARQLQQNLETVSSAQGQVVHTDSLVYLEQSPEQAFDIVFIDPPFRKGLLAPACELLERNHWLSDQALVYVERENEADPGGIPANWELLKEKQAGQVCYQLYLRRD